MSTTHDDAKSAWETFAQHLHWKGASRDGEPVLTPLVSFCEQLLKTERAKDSNAPPVAERGVSRLTSKTA